MFLIFEKYIFFIFNYIIILNIYFTSNTFFLFVQINNEYLKIFLFNKFNYFIIYN